MSLFRVKHNDFEEKFNVYTDSDTLNTEEWSDASRLKEGGWDSRYDYEAEVIVDVIKGMLVEGIEVNTILEVGSGPGVLSQKIQNKQIGRASCRERV
jgi:hypothetical protein